MYAPARYIYLQTGVRKDMLDTIDTGTGVHAMYLNKSRSSVPVVSTSKYFQHQQWLKNFEMRTPYKWRCRLYVGNRTITQLNIISFFYMFDYFIYLFGWGGCSFDFVIILFCSQRFPHDIDLYLWNSAKCLRRIKVFFRVRIKLHWIILYSMIFWCQEASGQILYGFKNFNCGYRQRIINMTFVLY